MLFVRLVVLDVRQYTSREDVPERQIASPSAHERDWIKQGESGKAIFLMTVL